MVEAGSSPRMRGKQPMNILQPYYTGLIPEHAGKTHCRAVLDGDRPAHPRACGENIGNTIAYPVVAGSSPRMRGKHAQHLKQPRR